MYTILASDPSFADQLAPIMSEISDAISITDIATLLGTAVAFGVPFFLIMYGARKLVQVAQAAIKNGKIKI